MPLSRPFAYKGAVVAITGGIGEGKSTVLRMVAEMGYGVASADALAREIFLLPDVNAELAAIAGVPAPIAPAALREAIAVSDIARRQVNAVMHARIVNAIEASGADFVEVPLLLEAGLQGRFDRLWVVTCGPDEQRKRLLDRYGDEAHISALLSTQLPTRAKIPFADVIVRTNESLESVRRLVSEAVRQSSAK